MSCEYYAAHWDGKKLRLEEVEEAFLDAEGRPPAPWQVHSCLGDDNKIWCEVYRAPGECGGAFVLRDFDEVLLGVRTDRNLDFIQTLDHFARITSQARYAADIFEHNDDGDDE